MTSLPHSPPSARDPNGWRLQWERALQQSALAVFFPPADPGQEPAPAPDADEVRRAAFWAAVVLGECRLRGIDLGELDGSLPVPMALAACQRLQERLAAYARDAEALEATLERQSGFFEATEPCFSLLEGRMEVWSAFIAIDESYHVCLEDRGSELDDFARALDSVLDRLASLDDLL